MHHSFYKTRYYHTIILHDDTAATAPHDGGKSHSHMTAPALGKVQCKQHHCSKRSLPIRNSNPITMYIMLDCWKHTLGGSRCLCATACSIFSNACCFLPSVVSKSPEYMHRLAYDTYHKPIPPMPFQRYNTPQQHATAAMQISTVISGSAVVTQSSRGTYSCSGGIVIQVTGERGRDQVEAPKTMCKISALLQHLNAPAKSSYQRSW